MSDYVTDEAVEIGLREFLRPRMHTNGSLDAVRGDLTAALRSVAPLIAAKALRDFADGMTSGLNKETLNAERRAIKREARARADQIEAGR